MVQSRAASRQWLADAATLASMTSPEIHDGPSGADLYKAALDEYRFQIGHNWSRTQYLLGFNVAILAAGVALAGSTGTVLSVLVFGLGAVAAVMTWRVVWIQHAYYRRIRDRIATLEDDLDIAVAGRLNTTAKMADTKRRASVNQLITLLLAAVCAADLVAIGLVLFHHL